MMKFLVALFILVLVHGAEGRTCVCGAPAGGGEVNVRSCPDTTCAVVGTIQVGECFDWQADSGVWEQINFNGATAYAHGDYLSGQQECGGGSYCTANLCSAYSSNQKRLCDVTYGCGNYGASRGSSSHGGWDVKCEMGATVYAPFDGTVVRKAYPYGDGSCCDTGFEITGSGQFSGHSVMMFYCEPDRISIPSGVAKGQAVATHKGLHCGCYSADMTDHTHYQLLYNGVRADPASWLFC